MNFSIEDFFGKFDQIRRTWSHLLKKYLMKNYFFWSVDLWKKWLRVTVLLITELHMFRPIIVNYSFIATRPHRKNLPQNVVWKLIIWLHMEKKNCRLLTVKSQSARGASHHPVFTVTCLTVSQMRLPCQPSR